MLSFENNGNGKADSYAVVERFTEAVIDRYAVFVLFIKRTFLCNAVGLGRKGIDFSVCHNVKAYDGRLFGTVGFRKAAPELFAVEVINTDAVGLLVKIDPACAGRGDLLKRFSVALGNIIFFVCRL